MNNDTTNWEWQHQNALAVLRDSLKTDLSEDKETDELLLTARESRTLTLNFAIAVVEGMKEITPPRKLTVREQLRRGRDVLTSSASKALEDLADWLGSLNKNSEYFRD